MSSETSRAPGNLRPLAWLAGALLAASPALASSSPARVAPASPSAGARPTGCETFLTLEEALELAFPKCEIERQTRYLTKEQQAEVTKRASLDFESSVVYRYLAARDGKLVGTAYFDTHTVRSLRETLMVVVAPDATIHRIEVLAFAEPKEYLPRDAWYEQLQDRKLDEDLQLNREIRNVTGATLSARATVSCARRVLALHETLARIDREAVAERSDHDRQEKKAEVGARGEGGGQGDASRDSL